MFDRKSFFCIYFYLFLSWFRIIVQITIHWVHTRQRNYIIFSQAFVFSAFARINTVAIIKANPMRSIALNTVFRKTAEQIVATKGSTQPSIFPRAGPTILVPFRNMVNARTVPTRTITTVINAVISQTVQKSSTHASERKMRFRRITFRFQLEECCPTLTVIFAVLICREPPPTLPACPKAILPSIYIRT